MKFRKGNKIRYGQDFRIFVGLPSGIDFDVELFGDGRFELTADGYGKHGHDGAYGNGALCVYGLTVSQKKRFRKAAGGE